MIIRFIRVSRPGRLRSGMGNAGSIGIVRGMVASVGGMGAGIAAGMGNARSIDRIRGIDRIRVLGSIPGADSIPGRRRAAGVGLSMRLMQPMRFIRLGMRGLGRRLIRRRSHSSRRRRRSGGLGLLRCIRGIVDGGMCMLE
jgi:hypothetical protein